MYSPCDPSKFTKRDAELLFRRDRNNVYIKIGDRVKIVYPGEDHVPTDLVDLYKITFGNDIFTVVGFEHPNLIVNFDCSDDDMVCVTLGAYLEVLPSSVLAGGVE